MYPSLTGTTGPYPGCLVSQPSRLLTTPEPHQGAGGREIPPCLCVSAAHVRGWAGGTSGLTMGWCLALLVLRGACLPHGGGQGGGGARTVRPLVAITQGRGEGFCGDKYFWAHSWCRTSPHINGSCIEMYWFGGSMLVLPG